ncbi:MAG: M50 family metallopeptidase [bacterium]
MSILITILILGFIVTIHEWGHFIAAKKSGVYVEEFAVGMGPLIYGKEKDGTLYALRAFPLGGYCKMKDEDGENSNDPDSFNNAKLINKFIIVLAGATMNFILAIVLFFIINLYSTSQTTIINSVIDDYPAQVAGMQAGDEIIYIDGKKIINFNDMSFTFSRLTPYNNKSFDIGVKRDGEILTFSITPKFDETGRAIMGIYSGAKAGILTDNTSNSGEYILEKNNILETLSNSVADMRFSVKVTIMSFIELFTGKMNSDDLMGPIGLTPVVEEQYQSAMAVGIGSMILTMLNLMALLSANIGVFNLMPIPALDGGRIVFMVIELIMGKPIPPEKEGQIHFAGFVLLMGFGIYVAYGDIKSLISNIF